MFTHHQIHRETERFILFWGRTHFPLEVVVLGTLYSLNVPAHEWDQMYRRVHRYLRQSHKRKGKWHIKGGKHGGVRLRHHGKKGKHT